MPDDECGVRECIVYTGRMAAIVAAAAAARQRVRICAPESNYNFVNGFKCRSIGSNIILCRRRCRRHRHRAPHAPSTRRGARPAAAPEPQRRACLLFPGALTTGAADNHFVGIHKVRTARMHYEYASFLHSYVIASPFVCCCKCRRRTQHRPEEHLTRTRPAVDFKGRGDGGLAGSGNIIYINVYICVCAPPVHIYIFIFVSMPGSCKTAYERVRNVREMCKKCRNIQFEV